MNTERTKICEKRIKLAELKLSKILHKIDTLKVDSYFISRLDTSGCKTNNCIRGANKKHIFVVILVALAFACRWIYSESLLTGCFVQLPYDTKSLFRSPEDCSMCVGVTDVIRLTNTSAEEFELYAYSTQPVIVTDATDNWKAVEHFNFHFFANFYRSVKLGRRINECFYFSYKSGLMSLDDVFSMDEARANLSGDPWYVGWSTCYEEETRALRQYYARPYFLPPSAESDMLDWIFMGGPGQGAHMHVDSVRHMSWQAQIRGRKQWQLAPPPECLYSCRWISFTVEPGEILVVDTNRWYHQTSVLPGDMSITIGAEYD
ncbi:uncharacterized protein LOC112052638 isoform X1 [Bicyclus anynana]|uniref:Uncharacterized protein LOC112052638 isoform X1 n=1 Tax=Bicyclus anynana TaxID=110368 RepID=A0A6J1NIK6_BICAN|nr:uncharacterized protein LOC112052638 isoform X1 [Bicyclus anynana]